MHIIDTPRITKKVIRLISIMVLNKVRDSLKVLPSMP